MISYRELNDELQTAKTFSFEGNPFQMKEVFNGNLKVFAVYAKFKRSVNFFHFGNANTEVIRRSPVIQYL